MTAVEDPLADPLVEAFVQMEREVEERRWRQSREREAKRIAELRLTCDHTDLVTVATAGTQLATDGICRHCGKMVKLSPFPPPP